MLLDYNLSVKGGAQFSTFEIARGLRKKFKVSILMPGKSKYEYKNLEIINIEELDYNSSIFRNPLKFLLSLKYFYINIKKYKPDIIHAQMPVSLMIVCFLKKIKLIESKIIFTERGLFSDYCLLNKLFMKMNFREIDKFITTTNLNYEDWKKYFLKNQSDKMSVIYNTAKIEYEKNNVDNIKFDSKKIKKIGFCARFIEDKDWDLAVKITEEVLKKNGIKVVMVMGCFSEKEKKDWLKLKEYLYSKYGNKVELFCNLNTEELLEFYDSIDLFILTSKNESFGRTAVEAMSRGCCVFGKNNGGLREVLGEEKYLFNNLAEVLLKIQALFDNDLILSQEKKKNYDKYYSNFSIKKNLDSYEKLYGEV